MPIPFVFIGIGAATAALGLGTSAKAAVDQSDAQRINKKAKKLANEAVEAANASRQRCGRAIEDLGRRKVWVLEHGITPFVALFEQIHNLELADSPGMAELRRFHMDRQSFAQLKELSAMAPSLAGGAVGGAAAGAVTALGAYGGTMALGAASTGTAITSLSGAAATNATLAFLGGGSLAAGGLGMAGGTAVLGGLVGGPALAVMGFVMSATAKANKEAARSNLARANTYIEEVQTARLLCKAIRMRASLFDRLLIRLEALLEPLTEDLARVIETRGTNYHRYSRKEKAVLQEGLSLVKAIKTVLDTPILTEDGRLTEESEAVIAPIQDLIAAQRTP